MDLEIELLTDASDARDADPETLYGPTASPEAIQPRIASASAYQRAGLERNNASYGVTLTLIRRGQRRFIAIRGTHPVLEPLLPLLIEVNFHSHDATQLRPAV